MSLRARPRRDRRARAASDSHPLGASPDDPTRPAFPKPLARRLSPAVLVVLVASLLGTGAVAAQEPPEDLAIPHVAPDSVSSLRIQARLLGSGDVEFGLELNGQEEWLPRLRFFPYATAQEGRWLYSSHYELSHGRIIRIQARLAASGKIEFGLELTGREVWLPRARFFPYSSAREGRWLYSSRYESQIPGEPQRLEVESVICDRQQGVHSVRLAWDRPDRDGGPPIIGYAISRLRALWLEFIPSIADTDLDATITGTSFVGVNVQKSELDEWSVQTLTATGISSPATVQFIFRPSYGRSDGWDPAVRHDDCDERATPTRGATAPGIPQDLRAEWDGSIGSVIVSWTPPAGDGGDRVTSYHVTFHDGQVSRSSRLTVSATSSPRYQTDFTVEGLSERRVRRYSVAAVNSRGTGQATHVDFSFEGAPGQPRNLRFRVLCDAEGEPDRAQLLWDPPDGSTVTTYLVKARWRGSQPGNLRWRATSETSFTVDRYFSHVFGGQRGVTLMVRAHNDLGPSPFAQLTVNLRRYQCSS